MYKRKFNPPALHKSAAPVAPPAAAEVSHRNGDSAKERAKQELANYIFGNGKHSEKENGVTQYAVLKPVLKKQKLFAAPTKPQLLRPVQHTQETVDVQIHGPQAAAGAPMAAGENEPSARVFSVLYTKREKWKVRARVAANCTFINRLAMP